MTHPGLGRLSKHSTVVSSPPQQLRKNRPRQCLPRVAAVRPRGLEWKGCFLWLNAVPETGTHQVQRQRRLSRGRPAHHLAVEEQGPRAPPPRRTCTSRRGPGPLPLLPTPQHQGRSRAPSVPRPISPEFTANLLIRWFFFQSCECQCPVGGTKMLGPHSSRPHHTRCFSPVRRMVACNNLTK